MKKIKEDKDLICVAVLTIPKYKGEVIAVSESIKKIKKYVEDIRGLTENDYQIHLTWDMEFIMTKFSSRVLYKFHGFNIPERDIKILKKDIRELDLDRFIHMIKLFKESSNIKNKYSKFNSLLNDVDKHLSKLIEDESSKEDIEYELEHIYIKQNVNIADGLDEYFNIVKIENEIWDLDFKFKLAIQKL